MKKILDLIVITTAPDAYAPIRIKEEAAKRDLLAKIVSYSQIDFHYGKDKTDPSVNGVLLPKARSVILRSSAKVNETFRPQRDLLFKLYSLSEAKILNENAYNKYTRFGKIAQYYEFQKGNIPFVESWNFSNQEMLKKWMSTSKLPLIIKRDVSSKGRDVIKIENFDDLDIFLDKHSNVQDYLVQGFIEGGEDLRVIVLGGKAIGAMKRKALEGEFLTNFSLGGQVSSYDIDQDKVAKSIAEKAAQHFCLDYVGVDLIKDRLGDWKLLEINSTCQFKGFEESTGINVASKIIDYLCNAK